jgi:hypothetical protein
MGRGLDGYFSHARNAATVQFSGPGQRPATSARKRFLAEAGSRVSVAMARGKHLFPFRTEKLSPSAPMVLGGRPPGRVGRRRLCVQRAAREGGPFFARHRSCVGALLGGRVAACPPRRRPRRTSGCLSAEAEATRLSAAWLEELGCDGGSTRSRGTRASPPRPASCFSGAFAGGLFQRGAGVARRPGTRSPTTTGRSVLTRASRQGPSRTRSSPRRPAGGNEEEAAQ